MKSIGCIIALLTLALAVAFPIQVIAFLLFLGFVEYIVKR